MWPAYAAIALLAVAAGLLAPGPRPLGALMLVGAAAAVLHAATTPEPAVTGGTQLGAVASVSLPAATACLVAGLGFAAARRGRGAMSGLLALALGWLLLFKGLPDVEALWAANVATAGPEWLGRIAVCLLVSLGFGSFGGGLAAARRFRELQPSSAPVCPLRQAAAESHRCR